jgi:hypothetical protein
MEDARDAGATAKTKSTIFTTGIGRAGNPTRRKSL